MKNSIESPVIILQADHGPGAYHDPFSLENTCLRERFSILNAYFLPGIAIERLNQNITPVNSFRIIFQYYFNEYLPELEDRSYYSTWTSPYIYEEITEKYDSKCLISEN